MSNDTDVSNETLSRLYTDPRFPGAYKGLETFRRHLLSSRKIRVTSERLREWRRSHQDYSTFKPTRFDRHPRRTYRLLNPDNIWEGDLLDMSAYARRNAGVHYILMLVDQFSKRLFAAPCKTKSGRDVLAAFRDIFERQTLARPRLLYTDRGREFTNETVNRYLTDRVGVRHIVTTGSNLSGLKCAVVERTNRTLKRVLVQHAAASSGRYIADLQHFVAAYNSTRHTSLGMAPEQVNPTTVDTARQVLEKMAGRRQKMPRAWDRGATSKLQVGWWVRMRHATTTAFRRGYHETFGRQLFQIVNVTRTDGIFVYHLSDLSGRRLSTPYYYPDLTHVDFPDKFVLVQDRAQQFTDPDDAVRYLKVRIAEYPLYVWIPQRVLSDRSAEEKRTHTISSQVFMHWLNS